MTVTYLHFQQLISWIWFVLKTEIKLSVLTECFSWCCRLCKQNLLYNIIKLQLNRCWFNLSVFIELHYTGSLFLFSSCWLWNKTGAAQWPPGTDHSRLLSAGHYYSTLHSALFLLLLLGQNSRQILSPRLFQLDLASWPRPSLLQEAQLIPSPCLLLVCNLSCSLCADSAASLVHVWIMPPLIAVMLNSKTTKKETEDNSVWQSSGTERYKRRDWEKFVKPVER